LQTINSLSHSRSPWDQPLTRALFLLAVLLLHACTSSNITSTPRTRLGSLPFPGPFTLYALADPDDLGFNHYAANPTFSSKHEHGHGILYTQRAGFLDMAHLREAMDWTWYAHAQVAHALTEQKTSLDLPGYDGSSFHLTFNYPPLWHSLPDQQRESLIDELALRIGQHVAFNAMTWHEIVTWYGYKTTLILPEQQSSFTYEDTVSHMVGIYAAADALRHSTGSWDSDATAALTQQLEDLAVVSPHQAAVAVEAVRNQWWKAGHCIRRNLDIGQDGAPIRPWLVREMPGSDAPPVLLVLPTLSDVQGQDFSEFWSMTIRPSRLIPASVRNVSPAPDHLINPKTHYPILIQHIRKDMQKRFGPNADKPYNDWPTTTQPAD
jgi:hypothetical protein